MTAPPATRYGFPALAPGTKLLGEVIAWTGPGAAVRHPIQLAQQDREHARRAAHPQVAFAVLENLVDGVAWQAVLHGDATYLAVLDAKNTRAPRANP